VDRTNRDRDGAIRNLVTSFTPLSVLFGFFLLNGLLGVLVDLFVFGTIVAVLRCFDCFDLAS
jgi:hypothetical protein